MCNSTQNSVIGGCSPYVMGMYIRYRKAKKFTDGHLRTCIMERPYLGVVVGTSMLACN